MIWIWLAVLVVAALIELLTPTALVSIWFAAGALGAALLVMLQAPVWLQIAVFAVISLLALFLLRPLATRYLRGNTVATNADRYIGCVGVAEKKITLQEWGLVRVEGSLWSAVPYGCEEIEAGCKVKVIAIEGAKLIVAKQS